MRKTATYYFEIGTFHTSEGKQVHVGRPVFALNPGFSPTWASGEVRSGEDVKAAFERVHPQAPLFMVIPGFIASMFPKRRKFAEMRIIGWDSRDRQPYKTGKSTTLTVREVEVVDVLAGVRPHTIPGSPDVQRNEVERIYPNDCTYRGLCRVGLMAAEAEVVSDK